MTIKFLASTAAALMIAAIAAQPAEAATATMNARILKPLSLTMTGALSFGDITLPAGGVTGATTYTVTMPSTSYGNALTCPAGLTCSGTTNNVQFVLSGTNGVPIQVTIPASVSMDNTTTGTTNALTVNLQHSIGGANQSGNKTVTLSNAGVGNPFTFFVGGNFTINSATLDGAYSKTFDVTASYQ